MTGKKYLLLYIFTHVAAFLALGGYLLAFALGAIPRSFCPFLHLLHLYCPGCGGTRAALALLEGNFLRALLANPTVPVLFAVLLYYEVFALAHLFGKGKGRLRRVRLWPLFVLGGVFLGFFLLRNFLFLAFGIDYLGDLTLLTG